MIWLVAGILVVGIVAPVAWLSTFNIGVNRIFNFLFAPEWVHVVAHMLLFGLLTWVICMIVNQKGWPVKFSWVAMGVFAIGFAQEGMQMVTRHAPFGYPVLFDLVVDLCGAGIGYLAFSWNEKKT
jgi:hypothetical protein